jgi:Arc/MetJ-type ribon-helix-helix transcriptional regulator
VIIIAKSPSVRRQFSFPKLFDEKIERLMEIHGCESKSELLRVAINKLEEEVKAFDAKQAKQA